MLHHTQFAFVLYCYTIHNVVAHGVTIRYSGMIETFHKKVCQHSMFCKMTFRDKALFENISVWNYLDFQINLYSCWKPKIVQTENYWWKLKKIKT